MNFNVAIIIDTKPTSGGGIQSINTAINLKKSNKYQINWNIYTTQEETYEKLKSSEINVEFLKIGFVDRFLIFLSKNVFFLSFIKRYKFQTFVEKKLISQNIRFIYFTSPSNKYLYFNCIKFATTVWDLCPIQYK